MLWQLGDILLRQLLVDQLALHGPRKCNAWLEMIGSVTSTVDARFQSGGLRISPVYHHTDPTKAQLESYSRRLESSLLQRNLGFHPQLEIEWWQ
jgi:hypothetical protein